MNKELRKMRKTVNYYVLLLIQDTEDARRNCKQYLLDIDYLQTIIQQYINSTADIFQIFCEKSVEIFTSEANNLFLQIKKQINMIIVNHYLNKFSYELSVCGIFQDNLKAVSQRLTQYEILT